MPDTEPLLALLEGTLVSLIRNNQIVRDLTMRQLAVLLICVLEGRPQTVRGLAERLAVPKPAISKALSRLDGLKLTVRARDPADKRSVNFRRTAAAAAYIREVQVMMKTAETRAASERNL